MALMTMIFAPISGRLVAIGHARTALVSAGLAMTVAGAGLTRMSVGTPLAYLIGCYLVFAIGFGLVNPPIANTAVSGMPLSQAGVAAAVASTSRQVGSTLGVAVIGSVLAGAVAAGPGAAGTLVTGILAGAATAWWIVAGCGIAVPAIGVPTTGAWARATVARTAALMQSDEEVRSIR